MNKLLFQLGAYQELGKQTLDVVDQNIQDPSMKVLVYVLITFVIVLCCGMFYLIREVLNMSKNMTKVVENNNSSLTALNSRLEEDRDKDQKIYDLIKATASLDGAMEAFIVKFEQQLVVSSDKMDAFKNEIIQHVSTLKELVLNSRHHGR